MPEKVAPPCGRHALRSETLKPGKLTGLWLCLQICLNNDDLVMRKSDRHLWEVTETPPEFLSLSCSNGLLPWSTQSQTPTYRRDGHRPKWRYRSPSRQRWRRRRWQRFKSTRCCMLNLRTRHIFRPPLSLKISAPLPTMFMPLLTMKPMSCRLSESPCRLLYRFVF